MARSSDRSARSRPEVVTIAALLLGLLVMLALTLLARPDPAAGGDRPRERVAGAGGQDDAAAGDMPDGCGAVGRLAVADRGPFGRSPFSRQAASFTLQVGDDVNPYSLMSAFVLPGEELELEPLLQEGPDRFRVTADSGELRAAGRGRWIWRAPDEPGRLVRIEVDDRTSAERMCLNVFVLVPYAGEDVLNGYRIGQYERLPLRDNPVYAVPDGMIEVRPELLDEWVSPHFQLRQFLCKQESDYPEYLILRTRLLLKLERLLEEVNSRGVQTTTFAVLSGFRTPYYNAVIGNQTRYSRHCYGDAADIYVDRDGNGWMDDIDGDGAVTLADAEVLERMVEELGAEAWYRPFIGGLGLYGPTAVHGPFIHVDTRGHAARW